MDDGMLHIRLVIEGLDSPGYFHCAVDPVVARFDSRDDPQRTTYRIVEEMKRRLGDELLLRLEEAVYG